MLVLRLIDYNAKGSHRNLIGYMANTSINDFTYEHKQSSPLRCLSYNRKPLKEI